MKKKILVVILFITLNSFAKDVLDTIPESAWIKVNNYWEQKFKIEPITYIKLNSTNDLMYTNCDNGAIRKWNLEEGKLIKKFDSNYKNIEINTDNENIIKVNSINLDNCNIESFNILNDSLIFKKKLNLPNFIDFSFEINYNIVKSQFLNNKNKYIYIIQNATGKYKYGNGSNTGGRVDLYNSKDGSFIRNICDKATSGFATSRNENAFLLSSYDSYNVHKNGNDYSSIDYYNNYLDSNNINHILLDVNGKSIYKSIYNLQFSPNCELIDGLIDNTCYIWKTSDMKPIFVLSNNYINLTFTNDSKRLLVFRNNLLQIINFYGDIIKDSIFVKDRYINNVICRIEGTNKFLIGGSDGVLRLFEEELMNKGLVSLFKSDTNVYFANKPVKFIDKSDGNIKTWSWDFGDNFKSNNQNPTHTYLKSGDYSVRLIVFDGNVYDTLSRKNYIQLRVKAGFEASDLNIIAPFQVDFKNTSQGENTIFKWYFGDGDSSNITNPTHIYTKAGKFDVKLIVSDGNYSDTLNKAAYITVKLPLLANFEVSNNIGETPFKVQFSDKSTGDIKSWKWKFGDGDSSLVQNPNHTYTKEGNYTVSLIVSDGNKSSTYTKEKFISVAKTGVNDLFETSYILFPNPASNYIELPYEVNWEKDINIYSSNGAVILQAKAENNKLDISRLLKGIYFIKLNDKMYKFVKE